MEPMSMVSFFRDAKILSFDLELSRDEKFHHLGAILSENQLSIKGNQEQAIQALDNLAKTADSVLGHNILDFDYLGSPSNIYSNRHLLDKPVIDTLYLSPLAFPRNPYHKLVKDYKLVRDTLNNPVADARLALSIFQEQLMALNALPLAQRQLYQYLFSQGVLNPFNTEGSIISFCKIN